MRLHDAEGLNLLVLSLPKTGPESVDKLWIRQVSSAAQDLMGYQPQEILSKPLTVICPEQVGEIWNAAWRSWRLGGGARHTIWCRHQHGEIKPWEAMFLALAGHEVAVLLQDFETRGIMAPRLPTHIDLKSAENAPLNAVVTIDSNKLVIDWNAQAETLFGWSRLAALGKTFPDFLITPEMLATQPQNTVSSEPDGTDASETAIKDTPIQSPQPKATADENLPLTSSPAVNTDTHDVAAAGHGVIQHSISSSATTPHNQTQVVANIQQSMLPNRAIDNRNFEVCAYSSTRSQAGGCFMDYFCRRSGSLIMTMMHASAHNQEAALRMLEIRSVLRAYANNSPAQALSVLDDYLSESLAGIGLNIAINYLEYNPHKQQLSHANAAHLPALLCRRTKASCQELNAEGSALGIFPKVVYEENIVHINSGDSIVLHSPALLALRNSKGETFGPERLPALLTRQAKNSAQQILDDLVAEINLFDAGKQQNGDVAVMVFKRK